jgi:hypothetical protein
MGSLILSDAEAEPIEREPYKFDPHGGRCLEYYAGYFDAVFFSLHPFVHVPGLDPKDCRHETSALAGKSVVSIDEINEYAKEYFAREKTLVDLRVRMAMEKKSGEVVGWKTVQHDCGFGDLADVCRVVTSSIGAVRAELRNIEAEERIDRYCSERKLFRPWEDTIPIVQERLIASLFAELGYEWIVLSDEFGTSECTVRVQELIACEEPWDSMEIVECRLVKLYPPDNSMLVVVGYDTCITKICGNRRILESVGLDSKLEGFWCTEETDDAWWLTDAERTKFSRK